MYLRMGAVSDFNSYEFVEKLALLQKTPKDKVRERKVGNEVIQYLPNEFCRRCLNFLFNFQVSMEILDKTVTSKKVNVPIMEWDDTVRKKVKKGEKQSTIFQASVTVRFKLPNGLIHDVFSTHKMYENNALADDDCVKAALSKAWTLLAKRFGIGDDLSDEETIVDKEFAKQHAQEAFATEVIDSTPTSTTNLPY